MKIVRYALAAFLVIASLFYFCHRIEAAQESPNVLFIIIDTLRADHLGCYGDKEIKTPNIDSIAKEGTLFQNAITQAPLTFPSHTTMFTSTYPQQSNAWDNGSYRLASSEVTLAQILQDKGYATGAFVSTVVLDAKYGLNRGFQTYDDAIGKNQGDRVIKFMDDERTADQTAPLAIKWLKDNKDKKFFLWVHFYDPHGIYNPPSPYKEMYKNDLYSGEVSFADHYVGKVLSTLKELGLKDKTLIVFAGDHGEGLGEHGETGHGIFVYDETLKVPLIFSYPKLIAQDRVVKEQVRLIDIMPTILDLVNIKKNKEIQGQSLAGILKGEEKPQDRTAFSVTRYAQIHFNWSEMQSWRTKDWKYIKSTEPELYNISKDPDELVNLIDKRKDIAKSMEKDLDEFFKKTAAPEKKENKIEVDEQTKKQLMSLGYVSGSETTQGKAPVPIKMIKVMQAMTAADKMVNSGLTNEAIAKYKEIIKEDPENMEAYSHIALCLKSMQRYDEAIKYFKKAASFKNDVAEVHDGLGNIYKSMGKPALAFEEFQRALKLEPDDPGITNNIGWCYQQVMNFNKALEYYEKAIKLDPNLATTHANMAICYRVKGNLYKATEELDIALKQDPKLAFAYSERGAVLAIQGKLDEATVNCKKAIELAPDEPDGYQNLGVILEMKGDYEGALDNFKKALKISPWNAMTQASIGGVYIKLGDKEKAKEYLNKALELDPNNKKAAQMLKKLEENN
jgi:arylsulfatase A-like enzyme/Flp pilus assembly protein TadD